MSIPTRQGPVIMQWMNPLPHSQGASFFQNSDSVQCTVLRSGFLGEGRSFSILYRAFHETVIITRDRNHINKSSTDLAEICYVVQAHAWDSTHQSSDTPDKNQKSWA